MLVDISQLVSLSTAARIAGISVQLFRYHLKRGDVVVAETIDKRKFFNRQAIEEWSQRRK